MRTRSLFGFALVGLLVASLSSLLWPLPRKHRINAEGYALLELGMTEQEVESILGVPAGDYGPGKGEILDYGIMTLTSLSISTEPTGKKWLAGSFAITVCFDKERRARGMMTDQVYRAYDSHLEMVCQQFGLSQKKPYPPGTWNASSRKSRSGKKTLHIRSLLTWRWSQAQTLVASFATGSGLI